MVVDRDKLRQRIRYYRAFLFSLFAIFCLWVITSMSDVKSYQDGVDTARYAVTHSDSTVLLRFTCNGFRTFNRSLGKKRVLHFDLSGLTNDTAQNINIAIDCEMWLDSMRRQLDMRGVEALAPVTPSLHFEASQRLAKPFVPGIDELVFDFEGLYGLNGTPKITPDTVWLYGSASSLSKINGLEAEHRTFKKIKNDTQFKVALKQSWLQYSDLRASTDSITVYVPVETFIEKSVTVPINIVSDGLEGEVRLYPTHASVTFWVTQSDYSLIQASDFQVSTRVMSDDATRFELFVSRFPAATRIKQVEPKTFQYIVVQLLPSDSQEASAAARPRCWNNSDNWGYLVSLPTRLPDVIMTIRHSWSTSATP